MRKAIQSSSAPAPIGPYSQALLSGNLLFASGQIGLDPRTGALVTGDIRAETRRVMENLKAVLAEAGMDFSHVVKASIFLVDLKGFAAVNEVYGACFSAPFPARETVQAAALPRGANVEISLIAMKD